MAEKKKLTNIKSGAFSRGVALARMTMTAGTKAAGHAVGSIFASSEDKESRMRDLLRSQVEVLARELGQLKGSVMKVGQMLSVIGENILPPEVNQVLKTLQSDSPPLEWPAIEKQLKRNLGDEKLAWIEVDHEPWASASLGQVHRARLRADGSQVAVKVQYPGVDKAIESDISALRSILSVSKLIPRGPNYEGLFAEVRQMLHQEVDYGRELEATEAYRQSLGDDPRYVIPRTYPELSTRRVLVTSYEEGWPVDSAEVASLPLERRNALGIAALDLFLKELFRWGKVQTDPHFGNYRVRPASAPGEIDRIVLFDFGAVRKFDRKFLDAYYDMVRGAALQDRERVIRGATGVGFMDPTDSEEQKEAFYEMCVLITEPFQGGEYDFGSSDLPKRAMRTGADLAFRFRLRPPPREIVFLDRKLGGVFVFLQVLKAKFDARDVLKPYLTGN